MPTDRTPTNGRTGGWVKLYRKLMDWEWYQDSHMVHLFVHLLLSANSAPRKWKGILIERGQYITTQRTLSDATGISQPTIHRCLMRLVECGAILAKVNQRKTMITICNYDSYQDYEDRGESKTNSNVNQI